MIGFFLGPLFISLLVLLVIFWTFGFVIRKLLGVERMKWVSNPYVNERHKKLDWSVRIPFTILFLISYFNYSNNNFIEAAWYFNPWFIVITILIVTEILRAFMEWKYAENKKKYIVTIAEMLFTTSVLYSIIRTDFFGIFN
ncbi:DUF4181 domain-containing protein [Solibacillus sp. FSL K6-1523]|uniref:DUF4181 domain-containing protein n=1 Tax=Solibacillus sp. FSL K6-1523 TaxID=2921471 RepID=UPI0030FC8B41